MLHLIARRSSPNYAHHTSLRTAKTDLNRLGGSGRSLTSSTPDERTRTGAEKAAPADERIEREKAAFVVLVRERELAELLPSMKQLEDRFNHRFHYPWIFLNDGQFSDSFTRRTSEIASGETKYGQVPEEHWGEGFPSGINETLAREKIDEMGKKPIPYGNSVPYRKMCRYQSGFFWRHPLLDDLEYYWRVEPKVNFFCDIDYDPFRMMREQEKKYGFTISLYEHPPTIPTLWHTTIDFVRSNYHHLAEPNLLKWLSDDGGQTYNGCHFWSNFEIASLAFFRSEAYRAYFDHLDRAGGFFYERWGDAPVHSIAAALFLKPEEIHFFADIGYRHPPYQQCPARQLQNRCDCNPEGDNSWEFVEGSCTPKFKELTGWDSAVALELAGL
ncbi:hypothetical protein JCM8097_003776 [Rhodosporidiobolus ruineniae]